MKATTLTRAALLSLACVATLAAIALWPAKPWTTPSRPPLKTPIVFDELQNLPSISSDASAPPQKP